jgi:hypothetical protein
VREREGGGDGGRERGEGMEGGRVGGRHCATDKKLVRQNSTDCTKQKINTMHQGKE